jgi:hypothetical protein
VRFWFTKQIATTNRSEQRQNFPLKRGAPRSRLFAWIFWLFYSKLGS